MGWLFSIIFLTAAAFSPAGRNSELIRAAYVIASGLFAIAGTISIKED